MPLPALRSVQYLLGLAHGCWVVSYQWVHACLARAGWVAERNYQAQVGRQRGGGGGDAGCPQARGRPAMPRSCRPLQWRLLTAAADVGQRGHSLSL